MFTSVAHAMGAPAGGAAGGTDALMQFMPLIIMLAIFYFLLIRPQQKRAKEHKAMLAALKKGDTVITNAGFIGRIVDIDGDILTIDLGDTKVQLGRGYVAGLSEMAKSGKTKAEKPSKEEAKKKEEAKNQDEDDTQDASDSSDTK